MEAADERRFVVPLVRSAALIEGLRLIEALPMGRLTVEPVPYEGGFAGRELRSTFNDLLAARGFVSSFDRAAWGLQALRRRLAFVATPAIEVDDAARGVSEIGLFLTRLAEVLALTHGPAPRIFAAAHEFSEDGGTAWRPLALMAGSGNHPGSTLDRILPAGDALLPVAPEEVWARAQSDPVVGLWLSLYRDVTDEARPDVRVLRACSLLEAVGRERLQRGPRVRGPDGQQLLDHGGQAATTKSLRGLMYVLVLDAVSTVVSSPRVLLCHETEELWDEVGVWADIRNMVAHEGRWLPPPLVSTLTGEQQRSAAAFVRAGRGDGLDAGLMRYADAVVAATEVVLRAVVAEKGIHDPERRSDRPPP